MHPAEIPNGFWKSALLMRTHADTGSAERISDHYRNLRLPLLQTPAAAFHRKSLCCSPHQRAPEWPCTGCLMSVDPISAHPGICRNTRGKMAQTKRFSLRFYHPLSCKQRTHHRHPLGTLAYPLCNPSTCRMPRTDRTYSRRILLYLWRSFAKSGTRNYLKCIIISQISLFVPTRMFGPKNALHRR